MLPGKFSSRPTPAKDSHFFLLAAPVEELAKESKDKKKAVGGKVFEQTDFAEKHSRVFRRLGLDLISVADDGSAVVHLKPEMMSNSRIPLILCRSLVPAKSHGGPQSKALE